MTCSHCGEDSLSSRDCSYCRGLRSNNFQAYQGMSSQENQGTFTIIYKDNITHELNCKYCEDTGLLNVNNEQIKCLRCKK